MPADEAVGVFDDRFFPGGMWSTEEGSESEPPVDFSVEHVLLAVVVSDGQAKGGRDGSESLGKGLERSLGGFVGGFSQAGISRFSFDGHGKGGATFADNQIRFPVTGATALGGFRRSFRNVNTTWDFPFPARDMARAALGVPAGKKGDEVPGLGVNPLVDGFVADDAAFQASGETSGNDFRGPFSAEPNLNDSFDPGVLHSSPSMVVPVADPGEPFGPEGVVVLLNEVPADFAGDRPGGSSDVLGDITKGKSPAQQDKDHAPFHFGQVSIGFHGAPF